MTYSEDNRWQHQHMLIIISKHTKYWQHLSIRLVHLLRKHYSFDISMITKYVHAVDSADALNSAINAYSNIRLPEYLS